jgi:hypothetical protein
MVTLVVGKVIITSLFLNGTIKWINWSSIYVDELPTHTLFFQYCPPIVNHMIWQNSYSLCCRWFLAHLCLMYSISSKIILSIRIHIYIDLVMVALVHWGISIFRTVHSKSNSLYLFATTLCRSIHWVSLRFYSNFSKTGCSNDGSPPWCCSHQGLYLI